MKKKNLVIIFFLLAVPYFLIFRSFFTPGALAWGDAPFFHPENLKELFSLPLLWNFKDNNFGSTQYHILWLYLPTFLYGLLNHFLGLENDILIRIIFYFPATILALVGSWIFISKYTKNIWAKFLGSFLYGFNTYFLMLIDGGQVGVSLAYGLFPLVVHFLLVFLDKRTARNYLLSLITLSLIFNSDLRIAFLAVFVVFLWRIMEFIFLTKNINRNEILYFVILIVSVSAVNSFWLFPVITNYQKGGGINIQASGENFISLLNAIFLFQPHFPENEFGKILPMPGYFVFLPITLFGWLLFRGKEVNHSFKIMLSVLFFLFVYLTKGANEPLGQIYKWMVDNFPLGMAFRDSSKFFAPLFLTGCLLIVSTIESAIGRVKNPKNISFIVIFIYIYLSILIYPAISGHLTGVLGRGEEKNNQSIANDKISNDQGFLKTLWFDEKPSVAYFDWSKPALSANVLYLERPFASMNVGQYDLYNFLHSPQFSQWFQLLGIKYIFLPGNERKKVWTEDEQRERDRFLNFFNNLPGLEKLDWQTTYPAYKLLKNPLPPIFAQKKAFLVVGSEDIYDKLSQVPSFKLANQGFIFLEEGMVDPEKLVKISPDAAVLVLEQKKENDLLMTFLRDKMVSSTQAIKNQWMQRSTHDYLIWRYDLLKQGIKSREFDFKKGIAFSTIAGEKIKFDLKVAQKEKYYLAVRFTNNASGQGLKLTFPSLRQDIFNDRPQNFKWEILGPFELEKGQVLVEITNLGGFAFFNTIALVSEQDFDLAKNKANELLSHFKVIKIDDEDDFQILSSEMEASLLPVKYRQLNPTQYRIDLLPNEAKWLIFTDHYHPQWELENSSNISLPFYAMVNGFYLEKPSEVSSLIFTPQKDVTKGMFLSLAAVVLISLILVLFHVNLKNNQRN